jgi:hypothetical protein
MHCRNNWVRRQAGRRIPAASSTDSFTQSSRSNGLSQFFEQRKTSKTYFQSITLREQLSAFCRQRRQGRGNVQSPTLPKVSGARLSGVIIRNTKEARKLYNSLNGKRPLLIARFADTADVIAARAFRKRFRRFALSGGAELSRPLRPAGLSPIRTKDRFRKGDQNCLLKHC